MSYGIPSSFWKPPLSESWSSEVLWTKMHDNYTQPRIRIRNRRSSVNGGEHITLLSILWEMVVLVIARLLVGLSLARRSACYQWRHYTSASDYAALDRAWIPYLSHTLVLGLGLFQLLVRRFEIGQTPHTSVEEVLQQTNTDRNQTL